MTIYATPLFSLENVGRMPKAMKKKKKTAEAANFNADSR